MKRIEIYTKSGRFGINYIHWLIEDCLNGFWVSSEYGLVRQYVKPKFHWEEVE